MSDLPLLRALAVGATREPHPRRDARLDLALRAPLDWGPAVKLAERHGLAGLAGPALATEGAVPVEARRALAALATRERLLARARAEVLGHVLAAADALGCPVLLLKGSALVHAGVWRPEQRAMRDLDLLVPRAAAPALRARLLADGLVPGEPERDPDHHHLASVRGQALGLTVSVELHQWVHGQWRVEAEALLPDASEVALAGRAAFIPSRAHLLHHVHFHGLRLHLWREPFRVIWAADLVAMLDAWEGSLDWERLTRERPDLLRAAAWLDALVPLSRPVAARLRPPPDPGDAGVDFDGWPRRGRALLPSLRDPATRRATLLPPRWWLAVRQAARPGRWGRALALLRHWRELLAVAWP